MTLEPNQILLTFATEEDAKYVALVTRRKGTTLENYILENYEWDYSLECMSTEKITKAMCKRCDFSNSCPDRKVV